MDHTSTGDKQVAYPKLIYKEGRVTHNVEIDYSICAESTNPTVEELESMDQMLVKRSWSLPESTMDGLIIRKRLI